MPLVSFFKLTKRSNKENMPQPKNSNKIPEASIYTGPSPYSVITQPKKSKGPRSCPGAPMNDTRASNREQPFADRHSQLNSSVRYENLPRKRVGSFEDNNCRRPHNSHRALKDGRGGYDSHFHYESFESDDDDYRNFINMQAQIAELTREEKKMRDKYRDYKRRLEETYEEAEYYRRNFERQAHAFEKIRKTLDNERKQRAIAEYKNKELTDAYKQANERIMDLEEKLNFFERTVNEHSLQEDGAASGAGEALCEQSDVCSRDLMNSDTPSVSMFSDGNVDPEKDEVRVFHLQDSDECDIDDEIEVERSLKATPLDLSSVSTHKLASSKIGKSLSDTNLQAMTVAAEEQGEPAIYSNSDWIKSFKSLNVREKGGRHHDSPIFSSSEDDGADLAFQQQQYEKQLRKIGDAVKYKPARKIIEEKYFRRYAKPERTAIETLNFLDELSSDASGLLSSPDFTPGLPRFN